MCKACKLYRIVLLVCCCAAMTGCTTPYTSRDIPPRQVGSPLKGVPPRTFVLKEFKDTRGVEPHLFGGGAMDVPVATIVRTAVGKELERNGHVCLSGEAQQAADYTIEGTVYKYWLSISAPPFGPNKGTANVGVKLTLVGTGSHEGLLTKTYEGSSLRRALQPKHFAHLMNQALLNMLEELTYDQQFIETIKK
jgi:hypothetical protein